MNKIVILLIAGSVLAVAGCGYSTRQPFKTNVKTVFVKPFGSRVFERRVELNLTEAVRKRINLDTPYRLAESATADTELSGEVLAIKRGVLGKSFGTNQPRETMLTMVISLQWKDLRTGKILMKKDRWLQTVDFVKPVGEQEYDGLQEAVDRMAESIVEQMQEDW